MPLNIRAEQIDQDEKDVLIELTRDVLALRASFVALTAKMDADATLAATDFGSVTNPPASNVVL